MNQIIPVSGRLDIFSPTFSMKASEGATLAEIVQSIPDLPEWFWEFGTVCVDGEEIYRQYWRRYRPLATRNGVPVVVTLHPPVPEGGGKGKQILTILAAVVLAVATAGIASGFLLPGITAAYGAMGANLVAAGIGIAGRMAIGALTPPPVASNNGASVKEQPQAGISGNAVNPLEELPAVLGELVYSPPHLIRPFTTIHGLDGDVWVHAIVGLEGRYQITEQKVNGVLIADLSGVTQQTRSGALTDTALTLNSVTTIESAERAELTNIKLKDPDDSEVDNQTTPGLSNPQWQNFLTSGDADEFSIRLLWAAGLFRQETGDPTRANMPVRIEMREVGTTTWKRMPEVHFRCNRLASFEYRREITFQWVTSSPSTSAISVEINSQQPAAYWRAQPGDANQYLADSYFNPGSGNLARHITRKDTGYVVYLETATYPRGKYEFRVMRGSSCQPSGFDEVAYSLDRDGFSVANAHFFTSRLREGVWRAAVRQQFYIDKCILESGLTVENTYPFNFTGGVAMMSIVAQTMQVNSISARFKRYANIWSGGNWATEAPTANNAALYRHVLLDGSNPDAEDETLLEPGEFETWYTDCVNKEYDFNAVVSGLSADQVLQMIASAGWAVPRNNGMRGIIREYDRSAQPIIQKFTPLNSSDFRVSREFTDLPHALRIEFSDIDDGYKTRDTYVYADGYSAATATRFEALTETGIVVRSKVRDKGLLYLRQLYRRPRTYTMNVAHEVLISQRGDLVGVTNDVLSVTHNFGIVKQVILSGGNMIGVELRAAVDMDFSADVVPGISIRQKNGVMLFKELQPATGEQFDLMFATPFPNTAEVGDECLVSIGEIGQEYRRCLIHSIEYKADLSASLSLLDVADEIFPCIAPPEEANPGIVVGSDWSFVSQSAAAAVASGNLTLSEPAGIQEGDLLVAVIAARAANAFTLPAGWTAIQQVNNATTISGANTASAVMAWRLRGATAPSYAFTRTGGDVAIGKVIAHRGAAPSGTLTASIAKTVTGPTDTMNGLTTSERNQLLIFACARAPDSVNALAGPTGYTCTIPEPDQFTERGYVTSLLGVDVGLNIITAVKRDAGYTGQLMQHFPTVSSRNVLIAAAFKPANS